MRAFAVAFVLIALIPVVGASHPGCDPDPSADVGYARVECDSEPRHEGMTYTKRVAVEHEGEGPTDVEGGFEHKYSTAGNNSVVCRVYLRAPVMTSRGLPCAGMHNPLLP